MVGKENTKALRKTKIMQWALSVLLEEVKKLPLKKEYNFGWSLMAAWLREERTNAPKRARREETQ
jgi:hypothetical protein